MLNALPKANYWQKNKNIKGNTTTTNEKKKEKNTKKLLPVLTKTSKKLD